MKKIDKFESISMLENDLNNFKGGDRSLRFNHWHDAGSFVDENGVSHSVEQRCSWFGFYETTETRLD